MTSKEKKRLVKAIEEVKNNFYGARIGNIEHQRAWQDAFKLKDKLIGYRNGFYGSGNPSWEKVNIPLNEIEINLLIDLIRESGVLNDR